MKKLLTIVLFALVGCILPDSDDGAMVRAISPDGRNEIRLWTDSLAYEVSRDGVVVVAKTEIGMKVNGECLMPGAKRMVRKEVLSGYVATPVYKKARVDLSGDETVAEFGDWCVRLAARNDGVAYRFETKRSGRITVNDEQATLRVPCPEANALVYMTRRFGNEGCLPKTMSAGEIETKEGEMVYLPFVYSVGGKTVAVTEADVRDYPCWYMTRRDGADPGVAFDSAFQKFPKTKYLADGWNPEREVAANGRWVRIRDYRDFLVETDGTRTFPWRAFVLADAPKGLCESDLVFALSAPQAEGDFSWVKPGLVVWDWWNAFYNLGNAGCNTKTYERFIDFAAKTGVGYVILDEGWSEALNVWKFNRNVDVPHLIDYAKGKSVDIILWMTCAQVYGEDEKIAAHFAALGAKGFKVDFMERADAEVNGFLEKFAAACAKHRMVINYHGSTHPTGLSRMYPNILNYEGVHGLEYMKFYGGEDMMANDVCAFFGRLTAGPMDYTPGAMDNYPVGRYPVGAEAKKRNMFVNPGSEGTRCHQMAQMVAFEAPMQMLSDSPTKYERNMECYSFMAATPVVWQATVGLGGCPRSYAAVARQAKDGSWYAAAINNREARDIDLSTSFLGGGTWTAETFRDADESATQPERYVHERGSLVRAGAKLSFRMAPGGGFVVRFSKVSLKGQVRLID